jgi:O-antigen/teichoic acid export membrane protein
MMSRTPDGVVRPRLGWSRIRPMLGFGARFQAVGVINIIRDLGLNLGTVLIAGVSTLGLWNLAYRVMQLPYLLFSSLWRVSYPAMARLLAADEPARPMIERGVGLAAVATGLVLAPLAGSATAFVPAVFGSQWTDTASVIPCASVGLMIGGPISVATAGYLYAVGDAATPLRATIAHTIVWLLIAFAALPVLGVAAIGIGWGAGSVVDAIVLGRGAVRHTQAHIAGLLVFPAVGAWLGAAAALGLTARIGPSIAAGIAAVVISLTVYMLVLTATCRDRASEVGQLVIAAARGRWAG